MKCRILTGTIEKEAYEKELIQALLKSEQRVLRFGTLVQSHKVLKKLGVGETFKKQAKEAFPDSEYF